MALIVLLVGGRAVPLYDGVVIPDPYRYLDPAAGQPGSPQGQTATIAVKSGQSDLIAVATPENIPQAQVFVIPAGLVLPGGTKQIQVSIAAVEPPALPPDGQLAGNVYAISVTSDTGTALAARPDAEASVELRAPDPSTQDATIVRFDGTSWQPVKTDPEGLAGLFSGVVTQFGDFAVLLPGAAGSQAGSSSGEATIPPSSELESAGAGTSEPEASEPASPAPGSSGLDRTTLTIVLGGAAVFLVGLVAVAALVPSRRRRPPGGRSGSGWSNGGGSRGPGSGSDRRNR